MFKGKKLHTRQHEGKEECDFMKIMTLSTFFHNEFEIILSSCDSTE